jgi:hypothetical protein
MVRLDEMVGLQPRIELRYTAPSAETEGACAVQLRSIPPEGR